MGIAGDQPILRPRRSLNEPKVEFVDLFRGEDASAQMAEQDWRGDERLGEGTARKNLIEPAYHAIGRRRQHDGQMVLLPKLIHSNERKLPV